MQDITTVEPQEVNTFGLDKNNSIPEKIIMEEKEKLGTAAIETVIAAISAIVEEVIEVAEDGKITIPEVVGALAKSAVTIFRGVSNAPEAFQEFKDLDSEEWAKLIGIALGRFLTAKAA